MKIRHLSRKLKEIQEQVTWTAGKEHSRKRIAGAKTLG